MTEQAHTSPSGESAEDKHVSDDSHSVLPHNKKVPTYNNYKPSTRVKQAAFNSSGNFFNLPATGRGCAHNTVRVGKQMVGFFLLKPLQKLTQACLDAHPECTSLSPFLCCRNPLVSEGEARGCEGRALAGPWLLPGLFSWAAPLRQDHREGFILPSCWGQGQSQVTFYAGGSEFLSPEVKVA